MGKNTHIGLEEPTNRELEGIEPKIIEPKQN